MSAGLVEIGSVRVDTSNSFSCCMLMSLLFWLKALL